MGRELCLIRGLPGSGKSTLAEKICERTNAYHVEADMYWGEEYDFDPTWLRQAHEWCLAEAGRMLRYTNGKVVVSNTFTTAADMKPYVHLAKYAGAKITVLTCVGDYGSIHNVPEHVLEKMKARWEDDDAIASCITG
mgnify:CR=1 FL=1